MVNKRVGRVRFFYFYKVIYLLRILKHCCLCSIIRVFEELLNELKIDNGFKDRTRLNKVQSGMSYCRKSHPTKNIYTKFGDTFCDLLI